MEATRASLQDIDITKLLFGLHVLYIENCYLTRILVFNIQARASEVVTGKCRNITLFRSVFFHRFPRSKQQLTVVVIFNFLYWCAVRATKKTPKHLNGNVLQRLAVNCSIKKQKRSQRLIHANCIVNCGIYL